jgi:hypothetical protein
MTRDDYEMLIAEAKAACIASCLARWHAMQSVTLIERVTRRILHIELGLGDHHTAEWRRPETR